MTSLHLLAVLDRVFIPDATCSAMCRLLHDDQKESGLLPVLSRLIKQFVFKYQSKEHAKDLVQALHVVLRLLERLSRNGSFKAPLLISRLDECQLSGNRISPDGPDIDSLTCKRRGRGIPRPEESSRSTQAQGSQRAGSHTRPGWGGW